MCRSGVLPAGAAEAFDLANRNGVVIGVGASEAAGALPGPGRVNAVELGSSAIGDVAKACSTLAEVVHARLLIIPSSPDGRDLAPLIATYLGRVHLAGATRLRPHRNDFEVTSVRADGLVDHVHSVDGPAVISLIPGLGGVIASTGSVDVRVTATQPPVRTSLTAKQSVVSIEVLPPDPTTMDLTEASCIVAGGQGLGSKERFDQLAKIGSLIGASLGGTRVASDAGWIPFERQIGTTGVAVNPRTYIAFGISGATQHTSGLGSPDHIISINTDSSCPMMAMSNVAIVADAQAVLDALERQLVARSVQHHDVGSSVSS